MKEIQKSDFDEVNIQHNIKFMTIYVFCYFFVGLLKVL